MLQHTLTNPALGMFACTVWSVICCTVPVRSLLVTAVLCQQAASHLTGRRLWRWVEKGMQAWGCGAPRQGSAASHCNDTPSTKNVGAQQCVCSRFEKVEIWNYFSESILKLLVNFPFSERHEINVDHGKIPGKIKFDEKSLEIRKNTLDKKRKNMFSMLKTLENQRIHE